MEVSTCWGHQLLFSLWSHPLDEGNAWEGSTLVKKILLYQYGSHLVLRRYLVRAPRPKLLNMTQITHKNFLVLLSQ